MRKRNNRAWTNGIKSQRAKAGGAMERLEGRRLFAAGFTPLAQTGWVASGSSSAEAPANAVDGTLNTRWSSEAAQTAGQYLQVDLKSAQTFNTVSMDAGPSGSDYPRGYSVFVSNTGTDWANLQPVVSGTGTTALTATTFSSQTARFVRIVETGSTTTGADTSGYWWSVAELNIGTTGTAPAAGSTPTPQEEYLLEVINRARANPTAEVTRDAAVSPGFQGTADLNEGLPAGTITTAAKQPLAFNPYLIDAAQKHSVWMNTNNMLEHDEGTVGFGARDVAAGYSASGIGGENIISWWNGQTPTATGLTAFLNSQWFIDSGVDGRGHRMNMMNGGYNEVGLGLTNGTGSIWGTEDFANAGTGSFLTGIAYNDLNGDNFYEPGEELGGVKITATRTTDNAVFSTTTWTAGGYSLKLDPGTYTVTATGGNIGTPATQMVTITNQNVEADFLTAGATAAAAPTIATQPVNQTAQLNNTTTFTAAANGSPLPTVQWQVAPQGGTFTNITGATGFSLTVTGTADVNGNQYRAVFTNGTGAAVTNAANLTVSGAQIVITKYPQSQTVNVGDTVALSADAQGYTGIQWYVSADGGNTYNPVVGATGTTLTFTATADQNGNSYQPVFTNDAGSKWATATLTVNNAAAAPAITAQPVPTAATAGGTTTLSVAATGNPSSTVQWQAQTTNPAATPASLVAAVGHGKAVLSTATSKSKTATTFVNVNGATGSTVTLPVPAKGVARYRAVITNANGSVTTEVVTVTATNKSAVTNDLTTLASAVKMAKSAIVACKVATDKLVANLTADFKRLKATKAQTALIKALKTSEAKSRTTFIVNQNRQLGALMKAAGKAARDSAVAKAHPTSTTLQSRVSTDLAALRAAIAASTVSADASDCRFATEDYLTPISSVAPSDTTLQTDISNGVSTSSAVGQALQAPTAAAMSIATRLGSDA